MRVLLQMLQILLYLSAGPEPLQMFGKAISWKSWLKIGKS